LAIQHTRRQFLRRSAICAALSLSRQPLGRAQPQDLVTEPLAPGITAIIGPDATSVAAESSDGVLLIDGGHASWSDELLERVAEDFDEAPITALINTHWHPEQTGSNVALGRDGIEIVAHENTRLWLSTEVRVRWSGRTYPPLPTEGLPTRTFYESEEVTLAGRTVACRYLLNAHTDGDICVFFPDRNVLVTGGVVSNDGWPEIDWWTGGWLGGMLDGYDVLLEIADSETRIVPSRGPVMLRAELESQHEMYLTLFDRLETMLRGSHGIDEVLAARPTSEYDERWGDPELFVRLAFQSMNRHVRDAYDRRMRNIP
jgi:cyclase